MAPCAGSCRVEGERAPQAAAGGRPRGPASARSHSAVAGPAWRPARPLAPLQPVRPSNRGALARLLLLTRVSPLRTAGATRSRRGRACESPPPTADAKRRLRPGTGGGAVLMAANTKNRERSRDY